MLSFHVSHEDSILSFISLSRGLDSQLPVVAYHVFETVVGVEAARAREHPDGCAFDLLGLSAWSCAWPAECEPVGLYPEEGYIVRFELVHLGGELTGARDELFPAQFIGSGSGALDDVREAAAPVEEFPFFEGGEDAVGEACRVEGSPEAVSRAGKMMAYGSRVETRVYPAEQDLQIMSDEVRDLLSMGLTDLIPRWSVWSHALGDHAPASDIDVFPGEEEEIEDDEEDAPQPGHPSHHHEERDDAGCCDAQGKIEA